MSNNLREYIGGGNLCEYIGCGNSRRRTPEYSFYKFPRSRELQLKWVENCGKLDLLELTPDYLQRKVLCSKHFDIKAYWAPGRRFKNSVPIHHLEAEIESPSTIKRISKSVNDENDPKTTIENEETNSQESAVFSGPEAEERPPSPKVLPSKRYCSNCVRLQKRLAKAKRRIEENYSTISELMKELKDARNEAYVAKLMVGNNL